MSTLSERVALLYYPAKAGAAALAQRLAADLPRWGAAAVTVLSLAEISSTELSAYTVAIPVGGDGTILGAARLCAPLGLPLLPVQHGRLGHLAEVTVDSAEHELPAYLHGDCARDARLMLQAELEGRPQVPMVALNEVVAARGLSSGPIRLDLVLGDRPFTTLWADGLIVASPTGSTAYTRSAGGPIVHAAVEALVLTAVAPQAGSPQVLVAPPDERVVLRVTTDAPQWVCVADGLVQAQPPAGATLTVQRAPFDAVFLRRGDRYRQQRRLRAVLIGDPRPHASWVEETGP